MKLKKNKGRTSSSQGAQSEKKCAPWSLMAESIVNLASLSMVEKLNLQATAHPHLYNIQ